MPMDIYQYDSFENYRFRLAGRLERSWVEELEHAWRAARSALKGREVVVDIGGLTGADQAGLDLLHRMRQSGARLTSSAPPVSPPLATSLGVFTDPRATDEGRGLRVLARRLARFAPGRRRWRWPRSGAGAPDPVPNPEQ